MDNYRPEETWHRAVASALQQWCRPCLSTAWLLWLNWRVWSILVSFCCYSCDIQIHHRCSFAALWSSNLMSLKLMNEGSLCCIIKCSVAIAVTLVHHLIVDMMMLMKEVVGGGVKAGWNFLDINNFPTSCMLLTGWQSLFNKQQ